MEDSFLGKFFTDEATMDDAFIIGLIVLGIIVILAIKPVKKMIRRAKKRRKKSKHSSRCFLVDNLSYFITISSRDDLSNHKKLIFALLFYEDEEYSKFLHYCPYRSRKKYVSRQVPRLYSNSV